MKIILNFIKTDRLLPIVLICDVAFYLLKTAFWPLTYLFVACYAISVLLLFIKIDRDFKLLRFIVDFKLPILLAVVFILEFLVRNQFSITIVQKDILLILVLFSLFYFLYWRSSELRGEAIRSFSINLLIIIISLISVLNLFFQFFQFIFPSGFLSAFNISNGYTIAYDYNFFCLFLLFGLLIINSKDKNDIVYFHLPKTQSILLNLLFILNIIISGSRRAILILIILFLIKVIFYIFSKNKSFNYLELLKRFFHLLLILVFFFAIVILALSYMPKQNLKDIISKYSLRAEVDILPLSEKILYRRGAEVSADTNHLIDEASFVEEIKLWSCVSAPGTSIEYLNTLYGKSIRVTRSDGGNDGYSLQYVGPGILYYANHTYRISFKIKFLEGNFSSFNVGWWANDANRGFAKCAALNKVSTPLNDGWYNCTSEYSFIDNHYGLPGFINSVADRTSFIIADFELVDLNYDPSLPRYVFEIKGFESLDTWLNQHNLPYSGNNLISNGSFENGKTFWRSTSDSSISVKIENIENVNCALITRGEGNGADWSLFYVGRPVEYRANNEYQIAFKILPVKPKTIPFKVGFWVDEGEGSKYNLKLKIDTLKNGWLGVKTSYVFKTNHSDLLFLINSQESNSQFYITDISLLNRTQNQYQTDINLNKSAKTRREILFSNRLTRWIYARELWKTRFSTQEKLLGHGFDYLEWYGEKFLGNSRNYDWPHNPFISVLLYSGIIGLLLYVILLIRVVVLYIKYMHKYAVAFIGFLITFFFSFFSGSSPFDPPIMGFFILLPFFIHSIHLKDNKSVTDN